MKSPIAFTILYQTIAFLILLTAVPSVFFYTLGKIILINKVVARVVGWVSKVSVFDTIER